MAKKKKAESEPAVDSVQLAGRAFEWELPKSMAERQLLMLSLMNGAGQGSASVNAVAACALLGLCVPRLRKMITNKFQGNVEAYGMAVMDFLFDTEKSEPTSWAEIRQAADIVATGLLQNLFQPKEVERTKDFSEPQEAS